MPLYCLYTAAFEKKMVLHFFFFTTEENMIDEMCFTCLIFLSEVNKFKRF